MGVQNAIALFEHITCFKSIFICCVFVEPDDGDVTEIIDLLDLDVDDVVFVDNDVHVSTGILDTVEHSDPVNEALSGAIAGKINFAYCSNLYGM